MLQKRIGVVAVNLIGHEEVAGNNIREVCYEVMQGLLKKVNIKISDVESIVSSSSDYWQGVSCSNSLYYDAIGANLKNSSKTEEDGASAFVYGLMRILSGHFDLVAVHAITKSSEIPNHSILTNLYSDPFFTRPMGLDDITSAALQANQYIKQSRISNEQIASIVQKRLKAAINNPYAHNSGDFEVQAILDSEIVSYPLRSMWLPPQSDGVCAVLLASEEKAKKLTETPAWIKAVSWANCCSNFGDRDILDTGLPIIARKAYHEAGIKMPSEEIKVAEICAPYPHQEFLYSEELGFCAKGKAPDLLLGSHSENEMCINPSGGILGWNPYVARGLVRIGEAAMQVMGSADRRQVTDVKNALAHSVHGLAGQLHTVVILGR